MRFRLAGHSCNHFLPNQLGAKSLFCSSSAFIWPSRSSAVLFLQHQKSQQTWAELAQEICARNHTISKEHKEIGEAEIISPQLKVILSSNRKISVPTFRRTEDKCANVKSFSSITFGMKNLPLPLHSDQNVLITAILVTLGLSSCCILYPLTILYPFSQYKIKMSKWIY